MCVASSKMFLLPHRLSARPEAPVSTYLMQISCCCGPCGVVGDALASSKHSGKSTGLFAPPSRSLGELFVPLPSRPRSMSRAGSAVVVPNTIRCAAFRRHSFRRRCSVRRRPFGYTPGCCACNRSNNSRDVCHGSPSNHSRSVLVTAANGSGRRLNRLGFALGALVGHASPSLHAKLRRIGNDTELTVDLQTAEMSAADSQRRRSVP